jgi:hypothetical protein
LSSPLFVSGIGIELICNFRPKKEQPLFWLLLAGLILNRIFGFFKFSLFGASLRDAFDEANDDTDRCAKCQKCEGRQKANQKNGNCAIHFVCPPL